MEHYVTLFDQLFLPQGLALHASLERHAGPYALWILCVDRAAHSALQALDLPNVRLLVADEVENDRLRSVKGTRTRGEYCWTLTPFAPGFVFDADAGARRVTYLDADLWLADSPRQIFADFEQSGKAVLITEHAYASEYDQTPLAGRFCVQFMTFVRDHGESVRSWWADRCIEWCFARLEDGKFGDQMYLNDWPERFASRVHVLSERGFMQAPWNATRFPPSEAKAFHFHGLRLVRGGYVLLTPNYRIPAQTLSMIYEPYLADLRSALKSLAANGMQAIAQTPHSPHSIRLKGALQDLAQGLLGQRVGRLVRL
jgi:hypothetical protein